MLDYNVTDAGYELLQKTGLAERINKNWDKISELLPHFAFVEDYEFKELLEKKNLPAVRRRAIEELKKKGEYNVRPADLFMISGTATDIILTKEEIRNYRKFGVESLGQLDSLLAAYCLSKYRDRDMYGSRLPYLWRSNGFKTLIYGDIHGDLQIHQVKTKPVINKNTIDGTEVIQLFGELPTGYINADYGYWPTLAAIALKYADTIGIEIPEANSWRELLKEYGWEGKIIDSQRDGVGYNMFPLDYIDGIIAQLPDKIDVKEVKKYFFGKMWPNANHEIFYLPVIDLEERLVFYTNNKSGNLELGLFGEKTKCSPTVYIPKSDVSHLFKGAVHGIMTHQSRTSPSVLAFMFWQYEQLKEGKSQEEIRLSSKKYRGY